ncbi:MAG: manganese efflux pump [Oscillospiraceae bacterium]|nr:manganese efflux pump [Oscillospiraceae bacterium]
MIKVLLLVIAVCTDCFAASLGIGSAGIRIPFRSAVIISLVGTVSLSVSVAFAGTLKLAVPGGLCSAISFILLLGLGLFNLFQNFWRDIICKRSKKGDPVRMFFDGASADTDGSKSISAKEALVLSAALSADSVVTGISAGLGSISLPLLSAMSFAAGLLSVTAGERLGRKIVSSFNINLGWLCGAVLIILAFTNK